VAESRWLVLIHQIPPKPDYLRVKVGRRLQRIGAVAIKNSVYVLPNGEQAHEDFQWVRREIVDSDGDASICEATFVDGLDDRAVEKLFIEARSADWKAIATEARDRLPSAPDESALARLRARAAAVARVDFFGSPERRAAEAALSALEQRARLTSPRTTPNTAPLDRAKFAGRVWVTRRDVFVDRMASAWLIRRFIDSGARFRFVQPEGHAATPDELRFDMFEGEFTHDGDRCTFETLLGRFGLADPALEWLAEIVHDIDLKDDKFDRPEAAGIECVLRAIASRLVDDETRIIRGAELFDALYATAT